MKLKRLIDSGVEFVTLEEGQELVRVMPLNVKDYHRCFLLSDYDPTSYTATTVTLRRKKPKPMDPARGMDLDALRKAAFKAVYAIEIEQVEDCIGIMTKVLENLKKKMLS